MPAGVLLATLSCFEAKIRERAARIAADGIMDEAEALEMLAIANGLSEGCLIEKDEAGCPLPHVRHRRRPEATDMGG
jgi:hypothetical protein